MAITNDSAALIPRTEFGGRALALDFPGMRVGVAEYDEGPTGCTVLHFEKRALTAADVRGGSPGVYLPDAGNCHALCFAGGSLLGLEACAGAAAELFALGGHKPGWDNIPCVQGAIIFDMPGPNSVYPDKALGRAAVRAARPGWFPLGPRGAGRAARAGKWPRSEMGEPCGQGAALARQGATVVAVITVVNACGAIIDRSGTVVRGFRQPDGSRAKLEQLIGASDRAGTPTPSPTNTTLTAVVTNQALSQRALTQLARQVHASMARAIQPFHMPEDGDVLFAVSTYDVREGGMPAAALGALASELAWDAVLSSFDP